MSKKHNKHTGTALGRSLTKDRSRRKRGQKGNELYAAARTIVQLRYNFTNPPNLSPQMHSTDEVDGTTQRMRSITESNDLDALIDDAILSNRTFIAEKQNVVVIQSSSFLVPESPNEEQLRAQAQNWEHLKVPRRPKWTATTTAAELNENEKHAFLEWRRKLAEVEANEHLVLTPFEKNLEVWRQLWRVIERSDIIIQIVDARNPLLFRCQDLDDYVKEIDSNKMTLLLVNKADLLDERMRMLWAEYFEKEGIEFLFFSANFEKMKMELQHPETTSSESKSTHEPQPTESNEDGDGDEDEDEIEVEPSALSRSPATATISTPPLASSTAPTSAASTSPSNTPSVSNKTKIYTRVELLDYLHQLAPTILARKEHTTPSLRAPNYDDTPSMASSASPHVVVGMVGYPNVGKSSTINVLCGSKKVAMSATPGKTKHLQTIVLSPLITLCDCPGLVFPNFVTSKAEMIVNGLLPIDQMRDYVSPATLVAQRIPREVLESIYGIVLPRPAEHEDPNAPPTGSQLLSAYAAVRGFMTAHGRPDESRAARVILKDYVCGKLLYCHPPPGTEAARGKAGPEAKAKERRQVVERETPMAREEEAFARQENVVARTTGKKGSVVGFTRPKFQHSPIPIKQLKRVAHTRGP